MDESHPSVQFGTLMNEGSDKRFRSPWDGKAWVEPNDFDWFRPKRFGVVLALAILVLFPGVALGWRTFYRSDYGVIFYPALHYCHQCFWRGELPLWNPLSNCGVPFLAQWGSMVLYPPSLIYLVFPLPWSLGLFCLGHLWLGGMGMFQLADRWIANPFAAAVAGFAFVFSGVTLSCLIWPNYTAALGWAPWLILGGQKAWQQGGRQVLLGAGIGALQMLTGAPELTVLTWSLLLVLWLKDWAADSAERRVKAGRLAGVVLLVADSLRLGFSCVALPLQGGDAFKVFLQRTVQRLILWKRVRVSFCRRAVGRRRLDHANRRRTGLLNVLERAGANGRQQRHAVRGAFLGVDGADFLAKDVRLNLPPELTL